MSHTHTTVAVQKAAMRDIPNILALINSYAGSGVMLRYDGYLQICGVSVRGATGASGRRICAAMSVESRSLRRAMLCLPESTRG